MEQIKRGYGTGYQFTDKCEKDIAAIISKHCAAEAGEVEQLPSRDEAVAYLESIGAQTDDERILLAQFLATRPSVQQIHLATSLVVQRDAKTRTNTISECIEKLSALSTLPFDATLYIRRDDAVATLESLRERGPQQVGQLDT
jgi:hypothetical protein